MGWKPSTLFARIEENLESFESVQDARVKEEKLRIERAR